MISGPSYFGGNYVAVNFAYGVIPPISPLTVHNVPTQAGAKALTLAVGYAVTSDGYEFYPLATNAPVRVGSDSNAEEVTPSVIESSRCAPGFSGVPTPEPSLTAASSAA